MRSSRTDHLVAMEATVETAEIVVTVAIVMAAVTITVAETTTVALMGDTDLILRLEVQHQEPTTLKQPTTPLMLSIINRILALIPMLRTEDMPRMILSENPS